MECNKRNETWIPFHLLSVTSMPFCRITACLTIEEKDATEVREALLSAIDALLVRNIRVFDSDILGESVADVPNADEIRKEIPDQA